MKSTMSVALLLCLILGVVICVAFGSIIAMNHEPPSDDYRIAMDSTRPVADRMKSAARLNNEDQERLRTELTDRLRGDFDKGMLDVIELLSVVGDLSTVQKLEALDKKPHEATGKFHASIERAIAAIRSRHARDY